MSRFFQVIEVTAASIVSLKSTEAGELVITVSQPNGPTEHVVLTIRNVTELKLED